ncbi:hypothetical protein ACFVT9_35750 [Kitasatospora cineracea]|uniref:hypothetical protein n=1 Tax=Kitasatospora cineracea TaxID=88074 RepID=UPI0036DC1F98
MDDLLKFLHAHNEADNHACAYVAHRFGGDALRALAQSYTEHLDDREEWQPETPEPTEGP